MAAGRRRLRATTYAAHGRDKRAAWMSMPTRGDCPSLKVGYATRSAAKREVRALQTRGAPLLRVYPCKVGDCRLWHLSSQERRPPTVKGSPA
jgi:hypothetical protein